MFKYFGKLNWMLILALVLDGALWGLLIYILMHIGG